jgi:hypothetical protein
MAAATSGTFPAPSIWLGLAVRNNAQHYIANLRKEEASLKAGEEADQLRDSLLR